LDQLTSKRNSKVQQRYMTHRYMTHKYMTHSSYFLMWNWWKNWWEVLPLSICLFIVRYFTLPESEYRNPKTPVFPVTTSVTTLKAIEVTRVVNREGKHSGWEGKGGFPMRDQGLLTRCWTGSESWWAVFETV